MAGSDPRYKATLRIVKVSILIMLANGWKNPGQITISSYFVSILIMLANGWKPLVHTKPANSIQSFNPHHAGEWLEESCSTNKKREM